MKQISKYIRESKYFPGEFYFAHYSCTPLYSFEDFCIENEIDTENKYIYENSVREFDKFHWTYRVNGYKFGYDAGQKFFYETLSRTLSTDKFIQKLYEKLNDKIISITKINSEYDKTSELENTFSALEIKAKKSIETDQTFDSLLNFFNYYIFRHYRTPEGYTLILRPVVSNEITDKIHKEEFLYHITSKSDSDKIMKYGFHPKKSSEDELEKTYFFINQKDLKGALDSFYSLKQQIIKKEPYKDYQPVIIKVDVSKLPPEMRFFIDDNYHGADACYTYEPVTPAALTLCE